jgi:hypothetical protein
MNIKLIKLLAAICAGLSFLIVCEWLYAVYAQKQLLESVASANTKGKAITQLPAIELAKRPESSYTDLVARPLFIQGRKPVDEPNSEQAAAANTATDEFNWSLNGIYTFQNTLYAFFSRTTTKVPKDNYRKVTKDSEIDGWKLIEIQKEKVVVSQGVKQKELPLRKAKPKDAPNNLGHPVPPPIPNQPGQPPLQPGQHPVPAAVPVPMPEPEPIPEPILEPELIPDDPSESYFENGENEQF